MPYEEHDLAMLLARPTGNFDIRGLRVDDALKLAKCLLRPKTSTLKKLDLSFNRLEDEGIIAIFNSLLNPTCKVNLLALYLTGNDLTVKSIRPLCEIITSPSCSIRNLYLSHNYRICDEGMKVLSSALIDNTSLIVLYLRQCNVSEKGGLHILLSLLTFSSSVEEIDLYEKTFNANLLKCIKLQCKYNSLCKDIQKIITRAQRIYISSSPLMNNHHSTPCHDGGDDNTLQIHDSNDDQGGDDIESNAMPLEHILSEIDIVDINSIVKKFEFPCTSISFRSSFDVFQWKLSFLRVIFGGVTSPLRKPSL